LEAVREQAWLLLLDPAVSSRLLLSLLADNIHVVVCVKLLVPAAAGEAMTASTSPHMQAIDSNHGHNTTQELPRKPPLRGFMARLNPFSFTPGPVVFVALVAVLLVVHLRVPDYPSSTPAGINLTQAWSDLEQITRQFHPYNSHANDDVRKYVEMLHVIFTSTTRTYHLNSV
jgi:hypothetical protein